MSAAATHTLVFAYLGQAWNLRVAHRSHKIRSLTRFRRSSPFSRCLCATAGAAASLLQIDNLHLDANVRHSPNCGQMQQVTQKTTKSLQRASRALFEGCVSLKKTPRYRTYASKRPWHTLAAWTESPSGLHKLAPSAK